MVVDISLIESLVPSGEKIISRCGQLFQIKNENSGMENVPGIFQILLGYLFDAFGTNKSRKSKESPIKKFPDHLIILGNILKTALWEHFNEQSGDIGIVTENYLQCEREIDRWYESYIGGSNPPCRKNRGRYAYHQDAFDNNRTPMIIVDPKSFVIIDTNPGAMEYFQKSRDELLSEGIHGILHLRAGKLKEQMHQALNAGLKYIPESACTLTDGSVVFFETCLIPAENDGRETVFVIFNDITEKIKISNQLKESETRFREALDATEEGLFELNLITESVFVSPKLYQILGYAPGGIQPSVTGLMEIAHPQDVEKIVAILAELSAGKNHSILECRMKHKKGNWIWVSAKGRVIHRDGQGRIEKYLGIMRDITGEKKIQEELKQSSDLLKQVFSGIPFPVIYLDRSFRIIQANRVAGEFWKKENSTLSGALITDFIPDTELNAIFEYASHSGKPYFGYGENRKFILGKKAATDYWDWSFRPVMGENDTINGYLLYFIDVSDRLRSENELLESRKRFNELAESFTEIFFVIDDDMNILYWNKSCEKFFRVSAVHAVGHSIVKILSKLWDEKFFNTISTGTRKGEFFSKMVSLLLDNERFTLEMDVYPSREEHFIFMRNISERIKVMDELLLTNRSLVIMSETSQAIAYYQDEKILLEQICRVFTGQGTYRVAWIGIIPEEGDQELSIVAQNGDESGFMKLIQIAMGFKDDPSFHALQEQKTVIIEDLLFHPETVRWRNAAHYRGFSSCIYVPMISESIRVGLIALFSSEKGVFTWQEVSLIEEVAKNVANGILSIRLRSIREKLAFALEESEKKYRMFMNQAVDGILIYNNKGGLLEINKKTEELLGVKFPQLSKVNLMDISAANKNAEFFNELAFFYKKIESNEYSEGMIKESKWNRNNKKVYFDINLNSIRYADKEFIKITLRDVTERNEAERKIMDYQLKLRDLSHALALTEERERRRLATELHDSIVQNLAISKITLSVMKKQLEGTPSMESLMKVYQLIDESIQTSRSLVFELSPPILYEFGLISGLEWLTEQLEKKYRVKTRIEKNVESLNITQDMSIALFQIVRELLMNVAKHSGTMAAKLSIRVDNPKFLEITVEDKGKGFKVEELEKSSDNLAGFGLFSIRERLRIIDGVMEIDSDPGRGTAVRLNIPLKEGKDGEQHENKNRASG